MHFGERFNSITHLVGAVLSVAGLATLVTMGALDGDAYKVVSFAVYGAMLFVLYAISTLYHSVRHPRLKAILQKSDHSAIYLLIAGSYTPFTLVTLRGPWGWSLFGVSWGLAALGITQELTLGRRTRSVSMVLYVLMGGSRSLPFVRWWKHCRQQAPHGSWPAVSSTAPASTSSSTTSASGMDMASGTCSCWPAVCANSSVSRATSHDIPRRRNAT